MHGGNAGTEGLLAVQAWEARRRRLPRARSTMLAGERGRSAWGPGVWAWQGRRGWRQLI